MKRIDLKSLAAGVLIGAGAMLAIAATGSTANRPTQYRVILGNIPDGLQNELNRAGAENWEFVGTGHVREAQAYVIVRRPMQ